MPQEGKRSIGYRPFMSCNDPRGVVERGTLRKHKNLNNSVVVGREEAQAPTNYHLLEVSRGAQKLNHVVSSWSCGYSNSNQRDMAKDLLKGALDLGESLAMLNRLQQSSDAKNVYSDPSSEEACCDDTRLDSSDAPSTSSSTHSSIVLSSKFVSPESFLSSADSKRKNKRPKGFNLIAKLMGLEDTSLRSFQYNGRKHVSHGEKIVNQKKPAYDMDSPSPRARKDEHGPRKSGWKRRTLDQMIEALKFKGSLRSPLSSRQSESSNSKERWGGANGDHRPPIVIMKPSRFSCLNKDHPFIPKPRAEVDEERLRNMKIRTNPLAETDKLGNPNFHDKEILDRSPSRSLSLREEFADAKSKGKASSPGKSRPHKKQSVEKNAEEAQKVSGSGRKGERKRTPKSESHLQSSDGDISTNLKPKSSRGAKDTLVNMLQSETTNTGRQGTRSSSNSRKNWPENAENVSEEAIELVNGNQRYREKNGEVHRICEMEDSTRLAEDASQIEITDYVDDDQSSPSETPLSSNNRSNSLSAMIFPNERGTTDHDKESQCSSSDSIPVEGATSHIEQEVKYMPVTFSSDPGRSRKGSTGENKLKPLLLSSPPFLSHVVELFDFKESPDKDFLQEMGDEIDHNDRSTRMLLDCANELVELHGSECCRACLSLSSTTHKMSSLICCYTSLDELLDEVCNGIEALKCYIKDDEDGHSIDNLLVLVKGDLRSGKMVTGIWDIGWRNAGSVDEIEEITRGMDELVLDGLIEEILVDLTL